VWALLFELSIMISVPWGNSFYNVCCVFDWYTVKPQHSAAVCSLQFVAIYRGCWYVEVLCNREFLFINFHMC